MTAYIYISPWLRRLRMKTLSSRAEECNGATLARVADAAVRLRTRSPEVEELLQRLAEVGDSMGISMVNFHGEFPWLLYGYYMVIIWLLYGSWWLILGSSSVSDHPIFDISTFEYNWHELTIVGCFHSHENGWMDLRGTPHFRNPRFPGLMSLI